MPMAHSGPIPSRVQYMNRRAVVKAKYLLHAYFPINRCNKYSSPWYTYGLSRTCSITSFPRTRESRGRCVWGTFSFPLYDATSIRQNLPFLFWTAHWIPAFAGKTFVLFVFANDNACVAQTNQGPRNACVNPWLVRRIHSPAGIRSSGRTTPAVDGCYTANGADSHNSG